MAARRPVAREKVMDERHRVPAAMADGGGRRVRLGQGRDGKQAWRTAEAFGAAASVDGKGTHAWRTPRTTATTTRAGF